MSWLSGNQQELQIPDADYEFVGDFRPPRMGGKHMPVQVAGRGTVGVCRAGLVVDGFKSSDRSCLMVAAFFAVFAVAIAAVAFGADRDWVEIIGGGLALVFASYVGKSRIFDKSDEKSKEKPLTLLFPWDSVRDIEIMSNESGARRVTVLIKGHKPRGLIHFCPEKAPEKVVQALRRAQTNYTSEGEAD